MLDTKRELAFPESVVDLLAGRMGEPPGGFPPLRCRERIFARREAGRGASGRDRCRRPTSPPRAPSWKNCSAAIPQSRDPLVSLYPRVCQDYIVHEQIWRHQRAAHAVVSVRPADGEESAVDIEQGKRLIIKFLTIGDPHPDGRRTVFFEFNGQPRRWPSRIGARKRSEPAAQGRPQNPRQVAAPMPGLVVTVAVKIGDTVPRGQKLVSMEAMKMETTLYADRTATSPKCSWPPAAKSKPAICSFA